MTSPETIRLQEEAERSRRQLAADLDALQRKVSPEALVERGLAYWREGHLNEFGRHLGRQIRDNPMPVALTAVGIAWLALAPSDRPAEHRRSTPGNGWRHDDGEDWPERVSPTAQDDRPSALSTVELRERVGRAGSAVTRDAGETDESYEGRVAAARGTIVGLTRAAGETLGAFAERIEGATAAVAERASAGGRQVMDAAGRLAAGGQGLVESGRARLHDMRDGVTDMAHWVDDTGRRVGSTFKEQPLVAGAVGLAVGMLAAMMLPAMRTERRLAGDVGQRIGGQVQSAARELRDSAGKVVQAMARTGMETAHEELERKAPEAGEALASVRDADPDRDRGSPRADRPLSQGGRASQGMPGAPGHI
jgi:hypothetical protein